MNIDFVHNIFFDKDSTNAHKIQQLFSYDVRVEVIFEVQFFIEKKGNSKSGIHQIFNPPPFGIC